MSGTSACTLAALALLWAVAAAETTARSTAQPLDAGAFTLYLGDTRIGEERFVIHEQQSSGAETHLLGRAELNLKIDGHTVRIRVALETTVAAGLPRRYEAEINGSESTTIVGTLVGDRFNLNVRSPEGEEMRQFLVRGPSVILDRHVAHQYFFAARLLGDSASAELSVIVPRDRTQKRLVISDHGQELTRIGSQDVMARHLTLTDQDGWTHHLWLEGNRLMRVEVPVQGFTAVRSGGTEVSSQGRI